MSVMDNIEERLKKWGYVLSKNSLYFIDGKEGMNDLVAYKEGGSHLYIFERVEDYKDSSEWIGALYMLALGYEHFSRYGLWDRIELFVVTDKPQWIKYSLLEELLNI